MVGRPPPPPLRQRLTHSQPPAARTVVAQPPATTTASPPPPSASTSASTSSTSPPSSTGTKLLLLLAIAAILFIFSPLDTSRGRNKPAVASSSSPSSSPSSSTDLPDCPSIPVPRLSLNYSTASFEKGGGWSGLNYTQLARLRRPIIVHGPRAIVHQWPAVHGGVGVGVGVGDGGDDDSSASWSRFSEPQGVLAPRSLLRRFPLLPCHVQAENSPSFATAHPSKPLEVFAAIDVQGANKKKQVDARCVLRDDEEDGADASSPSSPSPLLASNCSSDFAYFSLRLSSLPPDLVRAVSPLAPLQLEDGPGRQSNLWFGRPGLITSTHLDMQWNFFVQLRGWKRFTLFAPGERMRMYPSTHPRQAHVWPSPSVRPEGAESCEGFALQHEQQQPPQQQQEQQHESSTRNPPSTVGGIRRYVADLGPGDMLLVPPLWFHHVRTLPPHGSMSLNVWSDAPEYTLLNQLHLLPIPLESHWTPEDKVSSTLYYLRRMVLAATDTTATATTATSTRSGAPGGSTPESDPEASQLLRAESERFASWAERWVGAQRFHEGVMSEMRQEMRNLPVLPEHTILREAIDTACRGGLAEASLRAVAQWQTPEHESRWLRGLDPALALLERLRAAAEPVDPTAPDGASLGSDPYIAEQAADIQSLLLASYVEWIVHAMLGERGLLFFMQACMQ